MNDIMHSDPKEVGFAKRSCRFMPDNNAAPLECVKVLSPDGRVIHINSSGRELLELEPEHDLGGLCYADLWPMENRQRVTRAIRNAVNGSSSSIEGYCPTFAGTPRWWETVFYADKIRGGASTVVIGVSRDISLHRSEALAVQAAKTQFARLADTSDTGVLAIGHDGICVYCNAAAAAILGHTASALIGRPLEQILHRRGVGNQAEYPGLSPILQAALGDKTTRFEYERVTHRSGHGISVTCVVHPIAAKTRWCGSIVTIASTFKSSLVSEFLMEQMETPTLIGEIESALTRVDRDP
jgi:PAS domain S-box-containing protein